MDTDEIVSTSELGARVLALRENRRLTQIEVERRAGITGICYIEHGDREPGCLGCGRLSVVLGTTPDALLLRRGAAVNGADVYLDAVRRVILDRLGDIEALCPEQPVTGMVLAALDGVLRQLQNGRGAVKVAARTTGTGAAEAAVPYKRKTARRTATS